VQIVDRIVAGDALAAGVIHGWLAGDFAAGLRYGVTLAALALSQHGDMIVTTRQELELLTAEAGGDVVR
jgi:2-dehydro-3-deoxygluconokinase